jgi:hypothetical protein
MALKGVKITMGTNYYLVYKEPCPECNRPFEELHIGKSSSGWCFSLHVYPELGIHTLNDWEKKFKNAYRIYNEYDQTVTEDEIISTIVERSFPRSIPDEYDYFDDEYDYFNYEANYAVKGPRGLVRHKIDGINCIGHGEGTWDYIIGEFS